MVTKAFRTVFIKQYVPFLWGFCCCCGGGCCSSSFFSDMYAKVGYFTVIATLVVRVCVSVRVCAWCVLVCAWCVRGVCVHMMETIFSRDKRHAQ